MKQKLEIQQTSEVLKFIFEFSSSFIPLNIIVTNNKDSLYFNIKKESKKYYCSIFYAEILQKFSTKVIFKIEGREVKEDKTIKKTILLGNFKNIKYSYFKLIKLLNKEIYPYFTLKNNFALLISPNSNNEVSKIKLNIKPSLNELKCKKGSMILSGSINLYSNKPKNIFLILKGRKNRSTYKVKISNILKRKKYNYISYFNEEIFFSNIELEEDTYDAFWGFDFFGFPYSYNIRMGKVRYRYRRKVKTIKVEHDDITFINPYFTFKAKNLSFTVEKVDKKIYNYYKKIKNLKKENDVWLIGEQPFKAQDTGYHFFKYMRENFPDKNVYYVIEYGSLEYNNVKNLGNVIDYRSKEHFEIIAKVTHLIASHHPYYLLPLTHPEFQKEIKAKKVFLQHGVFGTKNISNIYGKSIDNFNVDMFLVSSKKEKKFATDDLLYLDDEVKITGLSRFDALFTNDVPLKKQILIIPTWRDWLQNYDTFIVSEYYTRYKSLLESIQLKEICKKNNLEIVFCLHPNMQKFVDLFDLDGVKVVSQGEVNVQHLLKESILMITDYSSVGFDFSFLEKPIIYYQFDTKRFLGTLPSHLDINKDLPGDIVREEEQIIERLQFYIKNNFKMTFENKNKSFQFLEYKDRNNNQRIKETIEKFDVKYHPIDKFIKSEVFTISYRIFRKSKHYFPIMKKFYTLMKLLPMKDRVVFESGLGLQYADAPRYIFEELLRRYPNREYIWIKNSKIYNMPTNVKVVERLSWRYYYYLARSKYWVNNQNFPYYITRRKKGIYLQTWHGTPLKKMLFDIEEIQGRDEGYIERVEQAKNQWSYLLSQSSYATEKFRSAFKYDGEILELGYSRNDILVNHKNDEKYINTIKNNINIPKDKKVLLYAPTFRDNAKKVGNKFTMPLAINFEKFISEIPEDYILLLRLHVLVKQSNKIPDTYKNRIFDVSDYSDIQELYLISDALITDYSSVFFDYANLKRPILFYAYDLATYRDKLRGFYLDYEQEVPGPILRTEEELYNAISNIDSYKKSYKKRYEEFILKYLPKDDGNATKRIVDYVFNFNAKDKDDKH